MRHKTAGTRICCACSRDARTCASKARDRLSIVCGRTFRRSQALPTTARHQPNYTAKTEAQCPCSSPQPLLWKRRNQACWPPCPGAQQSYPANAHCRPPPAATQRRREQPCPLAPAPIAGPTGRWREHLPPCLAFSGWCPRTRQGGTRRDGSAAYTAPGFQHSPGACWMPWSQRNALRCRSSGAVQGALHQAVAEWDLPHNC